MVRRLLFSILLLVILPLAACSSSGKPRGVEPPASSPLAKIKEGMSDNEVQRLLGMPQNQNAYVTGKSWIPFYWGPDTTRSDWMYKGQGRVVFSRNAYSGQLKVIRIDYDPTETAQ